MLYQPYVKIVWRYKAYKKDCWILRLCLYGQQLWKQKGFWYNETCPWQNLYWLHRIFKYCNTARNVEACMRGRETRAYKTYNLGLRKRRREELRRRFRVLKNQRVIVWVIFPQSFHCGSLRDRRRRKGSPRSRKSSRFPYAVLCGICPPPPPRRRRRISKL